MAPSNVNINSIADINDQELLTKLLDSTDDLNARKAIRVRLVELKKIEREKRDRRIDQVSSQREDLIAQRQRQANEAKARTLAAYDSMAKSGNAGDHRQFDLKAYTGKDSTSKLLLSGSALQKRDLVEETIQARAKACEENKKRLLAAYDYAAKTQPAGTVRDVDVCAFKQTDVSNFELEKPLGLATFQSSNGVPTFVKPSLSTPSTPVIEPANKPPSFNRQASVEHVDAYERALRQRKQEADERKRRTLAAYKAIAAAGDAGPKLVVQEELEHFDIGSDLPPQPVSCTTSFSGGAARN